MRLRKSYAVVLALLILGVLAPASASAAECTDTWIGPAEGSWASASNWSAAHAPGASDVACIGSGKTANVTAGTNQVNVVQGEGSLLVKESTLEILSSSEPSTIKNLTMKYKAVLSGPAQLTVSGTLSWTNASLMSGTGSTVLAPGAVGSITTGGGWAELNKRHLVNEGSFSINGGILDAEEGAVFENKGTLTVNHEEGVYDILSGGGTVQPKVVNKGVVQKTAGTGETHFDIVVENAGEINATTGTFAFTLKGTTGTFLSGSSLKGSIRIQGPTFIAESFDATGATIWMRESTLSITGGSTGILGNLTMDYQAVLTGGGAFEISKSLSWISESSMTGSGSTLVRPSATATVTSYSARLTQRTIVNEGTFSLEEQGAVTAAEGATLENRSTFNANAVEAYARFPGVLTGAGAIPPRVVNNGTIQKTVGTGNTRFNINVENNGTIRAKTGTLLYNQAGSTVTLAAGSVLEGTNRFEKSGIAGNGFSVPSGILSARESAISLEGGEAKVAKLKIDYGTVLSGSGAIEVTEALLWEGQSTLGGSGKLVLGPKTVNTLDSGATTATLSQRTLVNEGTFTQTSSSRLNINSGAVFKNRGTYNLNSEPYPTWTPHIIETDSSGSGRFVNSGLFQRTAGTINVNVDPSFQNRGIIKEQSSKVKIERPEALPNSDKFGKRCNCGDPIDVATGNFSESQTDVAIGGQGIGLVLTRAYSAQAAAAATSPGPFGYGWSGPFSDHLSVEEGGAKGTLTKADGSTIPFTRTSGTSYAGPVWSQETLSGSPESGYTFTALDQTSYRFSGTGRLESVTDRNGNETVLAYDEAGRLKSVTDPAGRQLTLAYNAGGQVESVTDPMGHVVKYAYEGSNLAAVTMPGEESPRWQFKYDASHRITQVTDGRGGKTINEYDASNRVISQTDPASRTMTFKYEPFHTTVTNKATGAVTDEWFTSNNEPFQITHGYGTASATTETFSYNEAGQLVNRTDGNGHTTTYGYDEAGNRVSEKDASGEMKWTYNPRHEVISETTPGGETTTIERDASGNIEKISRPGPGETTQTTAFAYDEHGQLEHITDPLERIWTYGYDSYGNRTSEMDPLGDTQTLSYDKDSRLAAIVSPRGNVEGAEPVAYETTFERDPQGRPLKVTDPLGHATEYAYDANGNLASVTDARGHATKYTYNADNERTKVENPNGATFETGYDGEGFVTSQTNGNGKATTYVRNALEQPVEVIEPLERKTTQSFDAAGNLTKVVDPSERTTTYSYDAANRLTAIDYSEEATPDVGMEYDAEGDMIVMTDGSGESSFAYDQLGRLTRSEDGHGDVAEYEYDLAGQQTGIVYPNGKSVSRSYDGAGRLESVTDWLSGTTSFAYDANSQLTAVTFPSASGNVDEYSYDRASRMSEAKFKQGGGTLASISYVRDAVGQVEEEARKGVPGPEAIGYGYDKDNRLIEAGSEGFEYDPANNLTKGMGSTNTYDAASELEGGTGATYGYDKLGERIKATPSSGPATTYGYNQAGNLVSIARPEEGEVPAIAESMAYDGAGLLTAKTSGLATKHLTWDVSATMPLLLSDGETSYLYGPGSLPIEQISSGEEPTYLHHDQIGSTRMLTGATGATTATFSYAPYGGLEGKTGAATTSLGFAGQYTDAETGLQYLRARFYDPHTGQFLTRDPLGSLTGEPYGYGADNPLFYVDPLGLDPCILGFIACDESDDPCEITVFNPAPAPCLLPEEAQKAATNASAGFGDSASFGLTRDIREAMGTNGVVEECSAWYKAGGVGGTLVDTALFLKFLPGGLAATDYWLERFAARYPRLYAWVAGKVAEVDGSPGAAQVILSIIKKLLEHH